MSVVNNIKAVMGELNINQSYLAMELTKITGKNYSQSMISKRLKSDAVLSMSEFIAIYQILSRQYRKKHKRRLHFDSLLF